MTLDGFSPVSRHYSSANGGGRNLPRRAFQSTGQFRVIMEQRHRVAFPVAYATARGLDLIDDLWHQKRTI